MASPKCPACETQIRLYGDHPQPNRIYRCHVCRLELVVDERTGLMVVAPLWFPPEDDPRRNRRSRH